MQDKPFIPRVTTFTGRDRSANELDSTRIEADMLTSICVVRSECCLCFIMLHVYQIVGMACHF